MTLENVTTADLPGTVYDPFYPGNDGRFMGETYLHNTAGRRLIESLEYFFADYHDVFIAMNIVFYYEQGNPSGRRDPDVLVARGVRGKHPRISYRLWEEGVVPCTLFEIASLSSWQEDLEDKRYLYAHLGVAEYFVFDADGTRLDPVLQGFRLVDGQSVEIAPEADGSLVSEQLGLRLIPDGHILRLMDLRTGQMVLSGSERADELAAEVERLRALIQNQARGDSGARE